MVGLPEAKGQTPYKFWSQIVAGTLACQLKLLQVQYHIGFKLLDRLLAVETADVREGNSNVPEKSALELSAAKRAEQGLAPPKEIYEAPLRHRIDWSKFPGWARPIDPEVFEGCSHEG